MNRTIIKSVVLAGIVIAAVVGCGDAEDSDGAPCGELQDGATLRPGESVTSCNGSYLFINQADGNVVLYRGVDESTRSPLWASNTVGEHKGVLTLKSGNLRLTAAVSGIPLYASETEGHPGAKFIMQDDGNGVIYDTAKSAVWATGTVDSGGGSSSSGGSGGGCKSNSDCHDKCKRCVLSTGSCVSRLSC